MSHVRLLFDEKSLSFVFWNTIREGIKATMEYNRMGSLFMPSMKTELVEGDDAFKRVLHYIHANPVHHGFVPRIEMWKPSSYKIFLSTEKTNLERDYVLKVFGGLEKFVEYHSRPIDKKTKWIDD